MMMTGTRPFLLFAGEAVGVCLSVIHLPTCDISGTL